MQYLILAFRKGLKMSKQNNKIMSALNELSKMQLAIKNTLSIKNKVKSQFIDHVETVKKILTSSLGNKNG